MNKIKIIYNLKVLSSAMLILFCSISAVYACEYNLLRAPVGKYSRLSEVLQKEEQIGAVVISTNADYEKVFIEAARLMEKGKGFFGVKPLSAGPVDECYIDWGGTLSNLTKDERIEVFDYLNSLGIDINILTAGAGVEPVCEELKGQDILGYVDSVILAAGSSSIKYREAYYKDTGVKVIMSSDTKAGYLTGLKPARKVLLFDDSGDNFYISSGSVIRVGVIGKYEKSLNTLLGPETEIADYYISTLSDNYSLRQLMGLLGSQAKSKDKYRVIKVESSSEKFGNFFIKYEENPDSSSDSRRINLINYGARRNWGRYREARESLVEDFGFSGSRIEVSPLTHTAIEALEQFDLKGKTVLDLGTGDGILAIIAAKLGAKKVIAVDCEKNTLKLAKDNAKNNKVAKQVTFLYKAFYPYVNPSRLDFSELGHVDLIIMNVPGSGRDNFLENFIKNKGYNLDLEGMVLAGSFNGDNNLEQENNEYTIGLKRQMNLNLDAIILCSVGYNGLLKCVAHVFKKNQVNNIVLDAASMISLKRSRDSL